MGLLVERLRLRSWLLSVCLFLPLSTLTLSALYPLQLPSHNFRMSETNTPHSNNRLRPLRHHKLLDRQQRRAHRPLRNGRHHGLRAPPRHPHVLLGSETKKMEFGLESGEVYQLGEIDCTPLNWIIWKMRWFWIWKGKGKEHY
jgi:hypothetical protein